MKKSVFLLMGLMCSAAMLAQATETEWQETATGTEWQNVTSADPELQDVITEHNMAENALSDETLIQIRSDCAVIAESEGIEEAYLVEYIETCISDNAMSIWSMENQEEFEGTEIPVVEYVEAGMEEDPDIPTNE